MYIEVPYRQRRLEGFKIRLGALGLPPTLLKIYKLEEIQELKLTLLAAADMFAGYRKQKDSR